MKVLRVTSLCAVLLLAFWSAGCGLNTGKPIEVGQGDGHQWAPDSDGKFVVVSVDNQFTEDIEFVAHGRLGIFKMFIAPAEKRYMVLKESTYTMELRTRKQDAGKAQFMELEERVLGVRRIHMRAMVKAAPDAAKSPNLKVPGK